MTADEKTLAAYGARVTDYEALPVTETQASALTRFLGGLPDAAHILDIGCGPGLHAERMRAAGFHVSAIDASPEFVAAARARGVDATLGSFDDITGRFDGIWASFSLLHARKADLPRHLAAMRAALPPGGRLFLGMKLGEGEHRDSLGRLYAYYTEVELRQLLDEAGFHVDHTETGAETGLAGTPDPFILIFAHA